MNGSKSLGLISYLWNKCFLILPTHSKDFSKPLTNVIGIFPESDAFVEIALDNLNVMWD
jgi:hypothetical protein